MRTPMNTFYGMKSRCSNPNTKYYGASGITVCEEWLNDPAKFVAWANDHGWEPGKHIHRIDSARGYSPDNCEFLWPTDHRHSHSPLEWTYTRKIGIPIGLDPNMYNAVQAIAKDKGWSMAEVIRKAITAMLEKAEKKEEGRWQ